MGLIEQSRPRRTDVRGRVATLGMFIIDQFQATDTDGNALESSEETIGGGGVYAMTCARLFLPPRSCAMIIDIGHDFPDTFRRQLEALGDEMTWFRPRDGLTTRALNLYSGASIGEGHQSFNYLAPQLQLHLKDLLMSPSPFTDPSPEWVHIVCGTDRAKAMVHERETIRLPSTGGSEEDQPWSGKLVWEPMPKSCVPAELPAFIDLAPHIAVISPNLLEVQTLLSISPSIDPTEGDVERAAHKLREILLPSSGNSIPTIIVRAGRMGSYTLSSGWTGWMTPYFTERDQGKVEDPTGGGNGFLGGLCAGLLISGGDMRIASIYAATAASFAIEQKGLPWLEIIAGKEIWNGEDPERRLEQMQSRVGDAQRTVLESDQ